MKVPVLLPNIFDHPFTYTSKEKLKIDQSKIATHLKPLDVFYPAEDYHQDYYKKNPLRYKFYKTSCGRQLKLKKIWD